MLVIHLCSQPCQTADIRAKTLFNENKEPVGSLRNIISFPESITSQDRSDYACAVALGYFLFHPKRSLLTDFIAKRQNIFVDINTMNFVIQNELLVVPTDVPQPLAKLRKELGKFVKRTLDTDMLQDKVANMAADGSTLIILSNLHNAVATLKPPN